MNAIRNNMATIVAGIVVIAAIAAVFVLFGPFEVGHSDALRVIIHDGDGGERSLTLHEDATIEVSTSLGTNVVVVESGTARITDADCPNQSCMKQKPISKPGEQLICLPHHLWVEVVQGGGADATQLDEGAVTWDDEVAEDDPAQGADDPGSTQNAAQGTGEARDGVALQDADDPGSTPNAAQGADAQAAGTTRGAAAQDGTPPSAPDDVDVISR